MLVQLRRVVYLLVLLHFCTCVINSVSGTPSSDADVNRLKGEIAELKAKVDDEKVKLDGIHLAFTTARNKYKTAVQRALNDSNACTEFAKEIETALKNRADYEIFFNEKKKKAEELVDRCTGAARDVRDAAVELNRTADDSLTAAEKLQAAAERLFSCTNKFLLLQARLEDSEKAPTEEVRRVLGVSDLASDTKSAAMRMRKNATAVKEETLKAEEQARAATEAADLVEKTMEKLKSAATGKNNADKGSQTGEVDQVKDENSRNDAVEQGKPEGTHNDTTRTTDNGQQTEAAVHEAGNTSSNTNTLESGNITSGSTSSTSVHVTVSGMSDSSSNPALLHSPLLLLVLLCVLGYTGVF